MRCRACDAGLVAVVDLGAQPSADRFSLPDAPDGERLSLRLGSCPSCGLVQLADPSPVEGDDPRAPSPLSSSTMAAHARGFVAELVARGLATERSRILCVASHGGHLAPLLAERGFPATSLERSAARAVHMREAGLAVVEGALDDAVPPPIPASSVDLVIDTYLLAHLDRPRLALARLAAVLSPGGTIVLEFDHLLATIEGGQWDAIRHGHQAYLTLSWISRELEAVGLRLNDAEPQPVYGGSLRAFASFRGARSARAEAILAHEATAGVDRPEGLAPLARAVDDARRSVGAYLRTANDAGRLVVGYGAPARSITFLNALRIGPDLLPYVVDRAPAKQGRIIPGTRIPIRHPEVLAAERPDEVLVLTWDLLEEVRRSLALPELSATRFLVAFPALTSVGSMHPPDGPAQVR